MRSAWGRRRPWRRRSGVLSGDVAADLGVASPGYDDARIQQAERDRAAAQFWARALLDSRDWLIVDTETTGLDGAAEVVQLGVLSPSGAVLLETLVRPTARIPWQATAIHGITDDHCASAPSYAELHPQLLTLIAGKRIVCYNAEFDRRILRQTAALHGLRLPTERRLTWECAMRQYAAFVGQWNPIRGEYRFQKLPPLPDQTAHTAIADCLATLALLRRMAG